jgi:hypothetical protein
MQIKAQKCFVALSPSRWVSRVFLTCDNMLAVEYRRGQHVKKVAPQGPGAYLGSGGVPYVCCLYPGTQGAFAEELYNLAQVWTYSGEWVHAFLYKKFGYQLVSPPAECGGCHTECSLTIDPPNPSVGQTVTLTCKITNTDGSASQGASPQGVVTFYIDGASIGTQTLPDPEPETRNWEQVSITWTASCDPEPTHTIEAVYTASVPDFAPTSCSASLTVSGCGAVLVPCCPNVPLPKTIHATLSNPIGGCACLVGTYALNWDEDRKSWMTPMGQYCGVPNSQLGVFCSNGGFYLDFFIDGVAVNSSGFLSTLSCSPLVLSSLCFFASPPCDGGVKATVTE